jgi:hypothetical protein
VDSGAERTCISLDDLLRLDGDIQSKIAIKPGTGLRGIGGSIASYVAVAGVGFTHDDQGSSMFALELSLVADLSVAGLPSLLGRDILFRGDLIFEPGPGTVCFDAPKGSYNLLQP